MFVSLYAVCMCSLGHKLNNTRHSKGSTTRLSILISILFTPLLFTLRNGEQIYIKTYDPVLPQQKGMRKEGELHNEAGTFSL